MPRTLTLQDARESLALHAAARGADVLALFGPDLGYPRLLALLADRRHVRYPCSLKFDPTPLLPGEAAHPVPLGEHPADGFILHVHPTLLTRLDLVPAVVLYQLVLVNYGEFASPDDAEAFGSAALGISREAFYERVCEAADLLA